MTINGPMTRAGRVATLDEAKAQFQMSCIACARGLTASVFWRVSDRDRDGVSRYRRCRPCAQQLDQKLLLFLGFGLRDPTHGLFGILPELIGL
jgi:hypothetical protein